jgi:hypothetical protein
VCSTLYKGDGLLLPVYTCYPWEMALNIGLDVSFDNISDWNGIPQKAGEVNSTKSCITNAESSL